MLCAPPILCEIIPILGLITPRRKKPPVDPVNPPPPHQPPYVESHPPPYEVSTEGA